MKIRQTALLVAALVLGGLCDPPAVARDGSQEGPSSVAPPWHPCGTPALGGVLSPAGGGWATCSFPSRGRLGHVFFPQPGAAGPLPFSDPIHDFHALLDEANAAFQQANASANDSPAAREGYGKAIQLYEKIIDQSGVQNAGLYYNLANAYFLKDDIGRAILNYRRAERLDRSDLNVKKNLAFARSRRIDRVETAAPKRVLETLFFWHYDLSLRTKFLLACLAFAALCLSGTAMIWRGRGTAGTALAALSAVLVVSLPASVLVEIRGQSQERFGVITTAQVVARQGDGPNYPPSFKDSLHEGTEFDLIEQRPGWLHIRLSDGADAWVPEHAAELG